MALKAIFFDFGGTLDLYPEVIEDSISAAGKMLDILSSAGICLKERFSSEEFYRFVRERYNEYRKWKNETLIELSEMDVWKNYILSGEFRRELLGQDTVRELTYLVDNGFHTRSVRPEARKALGELKSFGLITGIISNVLSSVQVQRDLVSYGLESFFDPVITSADFGRIKPHSSIFMHAAAVAGVRPEEAVYIGNSPRNDIKGAHDAGFMAAVQIRYDLTSANDLSEDARADFQIESLLELPGIISSLVKLNEGTLSGAESRK